MSITVRHSSPDARRLRHYLRASSTSWKHVVVLLLPGEPGRIAVRFSIEPSSPDPADILVSIWRITQNSAPRQENAAPGTLLLVGLTSGLLAAFLGLGDLGPIYTFSYLASGVAMDLMALFLGSMDNVVVAGLAGVVGNVAKMLVKTLSLNNHDIVCGRAITTSYAL